LEFVFKVVKKIVICIYKILNYKTFKSKVYLYGIPRLLRRENISFGENIHINDHVFIHGAGGVVLKDNVTLSYGATLISTGLDTVNWEINKINRVHKDEKIVIGKNVWICANVTILPGVRIEDDIIVAAGSVVTKDLLESGYIYGGLPAKKIKKII
jgi:acetyltransferase-like isoleucine patch superfamily enzyme